MPKEGLMRILALAILAIGMVSIGPAASQIEHSPVIAGLRATRARGYARALH